MHIVFQKDKDGYKKDWSGYVERSLARRFCEDGIAIPHITHLANIRAEESKSANIVLEKEKVEVPKKVNSAPKKNGKKAVKK